MKAYAKIRLLCASLIVLLAVAILMVSLAFPAVQTDSRSAATSWCQALIDVVRGRHHSKEYAITTTARHLQIVAAAISTYIQENGNVPGIEGLDSNGMIASKAILQDLVYADPNRRLISPTSELVRTNAIGTLLDNWDREIHFALSRIGHSVEINIWSDGPNRRNDNGKEDDVYLRTQQLRLPENSK